MERWLLLLVGMLWPAAVSAQSFPADAAWTALRCRDRVMTDGLRDQPGAVGERDIVGDDANPAGFLAADAQFLYLRMRLDLDPAPGGAPRPFAWGFALDTDDDPTDYEALIVLDGATGRIALHRNTQTTVANSPADAADLPPLATSTYAQRGRSRVVGDTGPGAPDNALLDLAVSFADLALVGIRPGSLVRVWVGTSTNPDRLDDDIACHDGSSGAAARLGDLAAANRTTADPGGGGTGPGPGQTRAVEGGPGCDTSGRAPSGGATLLLVGLVAWLLARRRIAR